MLELLTKEEAIAAASQGWSLSHVFDLATSRWVVQVYGMPDCNKAGEFVVHQARLGSALAIKALRLVQVSHQKGTV